jgi:cell division protein FtsI/penicillin-binding protein 2
MKDPVVRIRIISVVLIVFAFFLVTKLYFVQIVSGDEFKERADRQYVRPVGGVFERGTIFFQSKDSTLMAAASLKLGYTVAINPKILIDPEEVYKKLSEHITIDHDDFTAKAGKINDTYEEIAKRIEPDIADAITALDIKGVNLYKEKWRYYPGETMASHVLGFVGYNKDNEYGGRYGLENYYDDVLQRNDQNVYVNFFAEVFSDIRKTLTDTGTIEGDIVSTIEPNVQAFLEKQIQSVNTKYNSKLTGAVVIDPKTGEIYAMGAYPEFNPNTFGNVSSENIGVFTNPLVQSVYEMGSIIKPLTMAAGLDAGVVTADSTYYDQGYITLNNKTIYNYDKKGRGTVSMQDVLDESLNTGVAHVANKLGNQKFADYMYKYGFNQKTGIDLPNESNNLIENLKSKRMVEHATASFGQGIALTPITTVRALASLANGGTLITPHVVKKIDYNVGFSKNISYPPGDRVISTSTSYEISRMLTAVVDKALLNGSVKMDHYSVAAKTGTAQIAVPGGGYYEDKYLHSFFGYFPSYNPRFLVFLYTIEPKGEDYASHTLTEPFINTAKFLINYYEVPPDR